MPPQRSAQNSSPVSLALSQEAALRRSRIPMIEISEYAALRDVDHQNVNKLIQLLADGLRA